MGSNVWKKTRWPGDGGSIMLRECFSSAVQSSCCCADVLELAATVESWWKTERECKRFESGTFEKDNSKHAATKESTVMQKNEGTM